MRNITRDAFDRMRDPDVRRLPTLFLSETAAECERVKVFAVEANEQNFDRLEAELAKML